MTTAMTARPHSELTADPDLHSTAKQYEVGHPSTGTLGRVAPPDSTRASCFPRLSHVHRSDGRSSAASVCGLRKDAPGAVRTP